MAAKRLTLSLAVSVLAMLSACATRTEVRDVAAKDATWLSGRKTIADGSRLKMQFGDDSSKLKIKRVDFRVYEGELYLWPVRGQEYFEPVEFSFDTSALKLKSPWQEHVYWVEAANWDGPIERILRPGPLGDRVDRVKADVVSP